MCNHCQGVGHAIEACKKKQPRKSKWVVKKNSEPEKKPIADEDGFTPAKKGRKPRETKEVYATTVDNAFQALRFEVNQEENRGEGGEPSHLDG